VLEIGCGTGNNLWFLADAGFTIAGLDIAPTAIAIARERLAGLGHTDVDLRIGDLFSLPWPDEAFDIVIDRGALTCLPFEHIEKALSEVHRVLRDDGVFLSFYLFGRRNSDLGHGREASPGSYDSFTQGRFAGQPLVSVFDAATIRALWRDFLIETLTRHEITPDGENFLEERFSVWARRVAALPRA
jgi:SAM-dependent methyltransferase